VTLSFGRFFTKIRLQGAFPASTKVHAPGEIRLPVLLLSGGTKGLRDAIRRVRPDMVEPE
jgi:hypothetical protein